MLSKFRKSKIKLFDLLLIFIFFIIIISLFILLFRTKKELKVIIKVSETSLNWPNKGTMPWFANLFTLGMEEKDSLGKTMAKVIKIRSYDSHPDKKTVYLELLLQAVYSPGTRQYTYKGKNVLIGSTIQLFLDQVFVEGLLTNIEGFKKPYPQKKLKIESQLIDNNPKFPETYGVMPYLAENIKEGDQIKDNDGKTVLKILKKEVEEANKIVVTQTGEVLLKKDPLKKDAFLTFEILVSKIGDKYFFFDDNAVLVNQALPVHLGKISFWPTITKIEEIQ